MLLCTCIWRQWQHSQLRTVASTTWDLLWLIATLSDNPMNEVYRRVARWRQVVIADYRSVIVTENHEPNAFCYRLPLIFLQTFSKCWQQGCSDGEYIGIYIPPPLKKNQSTLQIFMWLLVVFISLTQDKFDIIPVCAVARVPFTHLPQFIPPPNEITGYAPGWQWQGFGNGTAFIKLHTGASLTQRKPATSKAVAFSEVQLHKSCKN